MLMRYLESRKLATDYNRAEQVIKLVVIGLSTDYLL